MQFIRELKFRFLEILMFVIMIVISASMDECPFCDYVKV